MREHGPLDSAGLAAAAGSAERYAREWLEQQAVAGILDVTDAGDAVTRRDGLGDGHAEVLLDAASLNDLVGLTPLVTGVAQALPQVVDAFRTGAGVPWLEYGAELRSAVGRLNRPIYFNQLAPDWFPAMPDVQARLQAAPPARVADFGCGTGWSCIAIGLGYPKVVVDGFDVDPATIA